MHAKIWLHIIQKFNVLIQSMHPIPFSPRPYHIPNTTQIEDTTNAFAAYLYIYAYLYLYLDTDTNLYPLSNPKPT